MIYREAGQLKTSYAADQAIFPIRQDRFWLAIGAAIAFVAVPLLGTDYLILSILIPFLILALTALGLNILTGYCGQLSLGTGGFMAVGAFAAFKITTAFPELNLVVVFVLAGLATAGVGILFGLPSLRIKGFYLAVATLAAQFFLIWLFTKVAWFSNYAPSRVIGPPPRTVIGGWFVVTGVEASVIARYLFCLSVVAVLALAAKNLVRARIGRCWMAIRDMDIAAEIIGIQPLKTKLIAFAVSSFYVGIGGALWGFIHLGQLEASAFDINRSFQLLSMVIIGGLGSVLGSFLGAAFVSIVPIVLNSAPAAVGIHVGAAMVTYLELITYGVLIVVFLIVEPHGLARLWQIGKEKLRMWPFPH